MPDAARIVTDIKRRTPGVKVVAITLGDSEAEVVQLAEAGVAGWVPQDGSLRRVGAMAAESEAREKEEGGPLATLTGREREILELVDQGMTNNAIVGRHPVGRLTDARCPSPSG